jgi:hypothetical protein
MAIKSIVSIIEKISSAHPIMEDVSGIATSPKGVAPMEVASIFDVPPLASLPPAS